MDKLQIIHLLEADFNFINKWLGQANMAQAEIQQLMTDGQYGSHKSHLAIIQCLNKHLCMITLGAPRYQQPLVQMMQHIVTIELSF